MTPLEATIVVVVDFVAVVVHIVVVVFVRADLIIKKGKILEFFQNRLDSLPPGSIQDIAIKDRFS